RVVAPRLPDTVSASRQWPLIVGLILTGLIAVPGMYWDIGWHIDLGRDTALAPPHVMMVGGASLVGIPALLTFALLAAAVEARGGKVLMPLRRWRGVAYPPLVLIGLVTIIVPQVALGLDELWHRTYGLDVSLWSPTHLLALLTAPISFLAIFAIVIAELNRTQPERARPELRPLRGFALAEGMAVAGMALFAAVLFIPFAEFDFDIPQWRLSFAAPVLAALTAFPAFLAIEALGRRFAATLVMGGFTLVRLLGVVFVMATGRTAPDIVLPVLAAFAIDLLVIVGGSRLRGRVLAGALLAFPVLVVGTEALRLLATGQEKWLPELFPYSWAIAIAVGVASGYLGVLAGRALRPTAPARPAVPRQHRRRAAAASAAALVCVLAAPAAATARTVVPATMEISPASPRPGEPVTVRVHGFERVRDVTPKFPFSERIERTDRSAPFLAAERKPPELQTFYGGKWIYEPLRRTGPESFETRSLVWPTNGRWMTTPTFYLGDLRWTDRQRITVMDDQPGRRGGGTRTFELELVDESAPARAPEWLKPFAYLGLALVALLGLALAVLQLRMVRDDGIAASA
ncbi:MAG TPA: hypothetical protein VNT54_19305, partial [Solirubrobacteraceae bacterium]|nr:hypothetical protein [Solirubrobacteraceae bacterium]